MLRLIDEGVVITLNGKAPNHLFVMAGALLGCAILVALVAMMASVEITLGTMALLAVVIFVFNVYRLRTQTRTITQGQITLKKHTLIAGTHSVRFSETAKIEMAGEMLVIEDLGECWQVGGFDSEKERHIAKLVLEGQPLQKNERAIRIL